MSARRAILTAAVGAVVLAALVVVAEATRQWRDWGCAGSAPPTPCVEPAVWHWSDIDAVPVVLGAGAGALLGSDCCRWRSGSADDVATTARPRPAGSVP